MKSRNNVILLIVFFLFVGIGVLTLNNYLNNKDYYVKTNATISDIIPREVYEYNNEDGSYTTRIEYKVYVDYMANGKSYEHIKYGSYDATMYVGKKIYILYDSRNPSKIYSKAGEGFWHIVCFGAAAFIGVIWAVMLVRSKK